ncbi:TPA: transcriptional regulator [Candidatus Poribacteria bacterium]|nr:transcriptional regulator [Candidatus Poribacteria bacterium]
MYSSEMKETAINRLKRVEGQMRGIQRLIENDSHCNEVMNQLFATRAAIGSLISFLFEHHTVTCLENPEKYGTSREIIKEMAKILNRYIK